MHPLITAEQLHALLPQPQLRLFDCRFALMNPAAGAAAYTAGHVPGAVFIDVNRELSAPHVAGKTSRHPLPEKAAWINTVRKLGITPECKVVLYDDAGGASAGRMWWMLLWIGHADVVVLDGGWPAWIAAGLPTTTVVPAPRLQVEDRYSALAPLVQLLEADAVDGARQYLIDARDPPRFKGDVEPIDPVAGHIPGATCSPFAANLRSDGRFKTPQELRDKFAPVSDGRKPVVSYCGSGITGCHNVLAMAVAGLPLPALYAGSWSEWITDPRRPIAKGE
ncbi:MAG TPA: sulfurtransferase [Candidatus Acidoferrum sp.]|nr:sulfurtransferase [Candidatus Acidoferrum sp.]